MELFESYDWLPNIEDIVDEKFVDEKRMMDESAMYLILNVKFQDPFADVKPPLPKPSAKKNGKTGQSIEKGGKKVKKEKKKNSTIKKKKKGKSKKTEKIVTESNDVS